MINRWFWSERSSEYFLWALLKVFSLIITRSFSRIFSIDYRCEHGRFWCLRVAWQFKARTRFSAVKQGLILEKEAVKELIWMSLRSESHWWYLFHKEVKSWDSTTWFRIWQSQTPTSKLLSSNASSGWTVFGGDERDFLKEGVRTYLTAPMSSLNSSNFFLDADFDFDFSWIVARFSTKNEGGKCVSTTNQWQNVVNQ